MRCKRVIISAVTLALALALGACSSGDSKSNAHAGKSEPPIAPGRVPKLAAADPSSASRMICEAEAKRDIASVMGVDTVQPLKPTWIDHLYSCNYVYAHGAKMTLAVKELESSSEITAYFDSLGTKLGKKQEIPLGISGVAYTTTNGSVVDRKDSTVLLVDISKLPANFGVRAKRVRMTRSWWPSRSWSVGKADPQ